MGAGLTRRQITELAGLFLDVFTVHQLLDEARIPSGDLPWSPFVPRTFWTAVSDQLGHGIAIGGRERLLAVLRGRYPQSSMFAEGAADPAEPASAEAEIPGPGPAVWNPPPRPARFVGRDDQLAELAARLGTGTGANFGTGPVPAVALFGMGGVGKTALAVEYVYRNSEHYDVVWWVPAEQAELVPGHLAELGEQLGLPAGEKPPVVLAELRRRRRNWLLVFDNAQNVATVAPFRPTDRHGRLLVTSRRTGWHTVGAGIEVPTLARAESVALLTAHVRGTDLAADRVAGLLGDLALAVEQAAAFCEQTGTPLDTFADLVENRLDEVIELGFVADRDAEITVATLWDLSVERLTEKTPAAVELLELLALCAAEPLPLDLLAGHPDLLGTGTLAHAAADPLAWARTLGALVSYSLVHRADATIWTHRLVQAATRHRLGHTRRAELAAALVSLLGQDLPAGIVGAPDDWPRWRDLLPHVRAVLAHADQPGDAPPETSTAAATGLAWLYDRAATYLREQGQPGDALALYRRALAIDEATHGGDHRTVARDLNDQAQALHALGRPGEAVPLLQRALAITEAGHGPDHPDVAAVLSTLGLALCALGRPGEALALFQRALAITEAAHGPEHPDVARDVNNQAAALRDLGRAGEALPLYQRARAINESVHGPDHPSVARNLNNEALALRDLGEPGSALPLLARTLAIGEAVHGPDHPAVATALTNQAEVLRDLGRVDEALSIYQRALDIDRSTYGPEHPDVARDLNNQALALRDLGRADEALALLRQVSEIIEATLGTGHPHVATALTNQALALHDLGRASAALPLYQRAVAIAEAVHGAEHPSVAAILTNRAAALRDLGQADEALLQYRRALVIREAAYGPDHPALATDLNNQAVALCDLGRRDEAVAPLRRALAILESALGPDHPYCAAVRANLTSLTGP
ncbi:tetratricopeptide repeat protein [Frankia sp. CNm7]|uniref:Tetratricopeptide repeat protein n=1 Tax=Frankia nepalensis TaxID=1836974 RepID=A0A937RDL3_9ACTN|nr:FxSxx-COOH system tetratricopeptide repeat protein [Frankia nepalensis]MBL7495033.1 tetratricopeptide repeat protein [Frankia nepalensis]MBL7511105.1 tetratricopeptide repeat protein [Frankia nepalensis]MBL7519341.1 tetratricopeptide repeat protein [Frankia nepalensis]MBL7626929.1 tetratricopeptide repeat protein [Frankia nepalensis]